MKEKDTLEGLGINGRKIIKSILSFSILSDDRFKASSKTIPPHSAI
jgi:hypothetical protein